MAATLPSGVDTKSGVKLTTGMIQYAEILRRAVSASIPLTITSGERDAEEQASAMLEKLKTKGESELKNLYSDKGLIAELLSTPRTVSAWAEVIRSKGQRLSRHLWGGAFDVRTNGLTQAQMSALWSAVSATGGRPLTEYDHLHVDLPMQYALMSGMEEVGTKIAARTVQVWLWGSAVAAAVLIATVLYKRKRK